MPIEIKLAEDNIGRLNVRKWKNNTVNSGGKIQGEKEEIIEK